MKFSPAQRPKLTLALLAMLSLVSSGAQMHASECTNTDSVTRFVREHGSAHENELYFHTYKKILHILQEFTHDLSNGKKRLHYVKILHNLSKELAVAGKKCHGAVHQRIMKLHKDFDRFVKILSANSNATVLAVQLASSNLEALIPEEAGWTNSAMVYNALTVRCS